MKNFYPTQVLDLRFQVDHKTEKNIQFFERFRNYPAKARILIILIRRREIKKFSDRNKIFEIEVI